MMNGQTHYDILGLRRSASAEDIRRAFICEIKNWHPDVNPSRLKEATVRTRAIIESNEVLKNPDSRRAYDRFLDERGQFSDVTSSDGFKSASPYGRSASAMADEMQDWDLGKLISDAGRVLWSGTKSYREEEASFGSTLSVGFAAWVLVLFMFFPPAGIALFFMVRAVFAPKGRFVGFGTIGAGMAMWLVIIGGGGLLLSSAASSQANSRSRPAFNQDSAPPAPIAAVAAQVSPGGDQAEVSREISNQQLEHASDRSNVTNPPDVAQAHLTPGATGGSGEEGPTVNDGFIWNPPEAWNLTVLRGAKVTRWSYSNGVATVFVERVSGAHGSPMDYPARTDSIWTRTGKYSYHLLTLQQEDYAATQCAYWEYTRMRGSTPVDVETRYVRSGSYGFAVSTEAPVEQLSEFSNLFATVFSSFSLVTEGMSAQMPTVAQPIQERVNTGQREAGSVDVIPQARPSSKPYPHRRPHTRSVDPSKQKSGKQVGRDSVPVDDFGDVG